MNQRIATDIIRAKVRRLRSERPRIVDLFCGAGGFSLGFERAGCAILGGVELDDFAAQTHARNFPSPSEAGDGERAHTGGVNIREVDPDRWLADLGFEDPTSAVDVIIGGPPCPAFTRVGRAKLREVANHPEAYKNDPRAQLYRPYLNWVRRLAPVAVVMENVPDVLNWGGHNLAEEICEVLEEDLGYRCSYTVLNAAAYGVPQMRPRFVLVATHRELDATFQFPSPTHRVELPRGYEQALNAALRPLRAMATPGRSRWVAPPEPPTDVPTAVTAQEALRDLPHMRGCGGPLRVPTPGSQAPTEWARHHALGWPGREVGGAATTGHQIRSLSWRDYRLFERMLPGDQYVEAYRLSLRLLEEQLSAISKDGASLPDDATVAQALSTDLAQVLSDFIAARKRGRSLPRAAARVADRLDAAAPLCVEVARATVAWRDELGRRAVAGVEPTAISDPPLESRIGLASRVCRAIVSARASEEVETLADLIGAASVSHLFNSTWRSQARRRAWRNGLEAIGGETLSLFGGQDGPRVWSTDRGLELEFSFDRAELRKHVATLQAVAAEDLASVIDHSAEAVWALVETLVVSVSQRIGVFCQLKRQFVPPYVPDKFPNRWRKMEADLPARTLMAHLGKDSYSHIHYDSEQARTITIREAARLQSFPDTFDFEGPMNPSFRQIGNAVPPLLAWHVADALRATLAKGSAHQPSGTPARGERLP